MATIAITSIFEDPLKLNKNIFYKFNVPKGRGDISKIKFKKKNIYLIAVKKANVSIYINLMKYFMVKIYMIKLEKN